MRRDDRAQRVAAFIICTVLLCGPALWNRFALLQFDTGGYLARWFEGTLVPSRAVVYGLILNAGSIADFWPVVVLQSALTVWMIALTLRVYRVSTRPSVLIAVVAVLAVATTLPWLTAILLTDIFCGLGVLGLSLLLLQREALGAAERLALMLLVAAAAATHSATLAVLLALLAATPLIAPSGALLRLRGGVIAIGLGALLVLSANFLVAGRLAWTPGGFALSFGRMLQDGIVDRYLADHCPDQRLQLCAHRAELPRNADELFWGSALFDQLGRFAGLGPEMAHIAIDSIKDYPLLQIETAATATARQLIAVHSGEGVVDTIWHTYAIIEQHTPWAARAMHAARQQNGGIDFTLINAVHWPVALAMFAALCAVAAGFPRVPADARRLAAAVALAILANAVICGVLSNPHDRYGARLAWLPAFVVIVCALRRRAAT